MAAKKKAAKKAAKKGAKKAASSSSCKNVVVQGKKRKLCWGSTGTQPAYPGYGIVSNKPSR